MAEKEDPEATAGLLKVLIFSFEGSLSLQKVGFFPCFF